MTGLGCGSSLCRVEKTIGQVTNGKCSCFDGLNTEKRLNLEKYISLLKKEILDLKTLKTPSMLEKIMEVREIEKVENLCPSCSGRGRRAYGSTSIWMGGIGGQQITSGICDECWGSGDITRNFVNLRKMYNKSKIKK